MLNLKMNDGEEITIGCADSMIEYDENYGGEYGYLIWLDKTLQENGAEKIVLCTPSDFDYYDQDKEQLDILMDIN
jgi:aspartate/glutamate racemase